MSTKIFVNLPVKDLTRSVDFFTRLGFQFNPQFTDETTWFARQSPPAAQPTPNRKTTASCINTGSRIPMGTFGS